ncbi:MAG: FkbM family methyltransferase, partial [Chloroflexota bacterium]
QSNTYFLEKSLNWRGILIEGIPELYQQCLEERKNARVFHCALVEICHHLSTVSMHYANLMSLVDGALKTPSAQENHVQAGLEIQELDHTYSVRVPARTLESILDEVPHLPKIDFLSLDVEGYELQVLKGLNLTKYRPIYILVEAKFFDEVDQFLTHHHYKMLEQMTHHDYFYIDALSAVHK